MSNSTTLSFLFFGLLGFFPLSAKPSSIQIENPSWRAQSFSMLLDEQVLEFKKVHSSVLRQGAFSWSGQFAGDGTSSLSLVRVEGHYHGTLLWEGVTYSFNGLGPKLQLSEAGPSLPCGGCKVSSSLPPDPRRAGQVARTWRTGDANLIDLLVVYPDEVLNEAGGESALSAAILGAVADANLCYRNSGLDLRLRLVHHAETNYDPSGVLNTDLERIKETSDNYMDEVHGLRDQYGADLVALLTTPSDTGGLANTMSSPSLNFEDSGFSVSVWDQIGAPSYTLAHEVGHNMGCLHNREDDETADGGQDYDLFAFSFGKRWQDENSGYRTIMSYDNEAENFPTKIPYFSNPEVSYLGVTTGNVGTENNAKVLSITAPYVSNFRQAKIQAIEPSVYSLDLAEANSSSFGVRLAMEPAAPIQVAVNLSGDSDFQIIGSSLMNFDASNWNLRQPVAVYAGSDGDDENGTATLSLSSEGITTVTVNLAEADRNSYVDSSYFSFGGIVTNELGVGLEGVEVTFSDGQTSVFTDANGVFVGILPSGWTGTASLSKSGYEFTPANVSVSSLSAHSLSHSFSSSRSMILYVDQDAVGQGDGTSWVNAYTDLGKALQSEVDFQEVWVAEGTYLPGEVRTDTFILPPNIKVYGGFSGNETARSQRDSSTYFSILSGDLGVANVYTDNAYHVVSPAEGSTLDGFVLQDGYASKNITGDDRGKGAALWADGIAFTISNCTFQSNRSFQGGSAVYLKDTNATFLHCVFSNNFTDSTGSGGAVYLEDSDASFESCSFVQNQAHYYGGAIRSDSSVLDLHLCTFTSNRSVTSNGGGALYMLGGTFNVRLSAFTSNSASYDGGAVLADEASGSFADSNFSGNLNTEFNGGGALHFRDTNASLSSCRFEENLTYAENYGGAIKFSNSQSSVSSCAFVSNRSLNNSAGALYGDGTSILSVSDSNFTDNQASHGGAIYINSGGVCSMSGNRFVKNSANDGGAVYLSKFATSKITENDFIENNSNQFGGALFLNDGSLEIEGGTFYRNSSNFGGAVSVHNSSLITFDGVKGLGNEANKTTSGMGGFLYQNSDSLRADFINCVLSGNRAKDYGGVVKQSGNLTFTNCTVVGNISETLGGVVILFDGDVLTLENSILWQNQASVDGNDIAVNTGTASAHYSLYDPSQSYGSISGTSNLSDSPMFVDIDGSDGIGGTLDDDLQLQAGSPGINQGSTSFSNYSATDLLNQGRSGLPDLGAYEYWADSPPTITSSSTVSAEENQTSALIVSATDAESSPLTFEISGGSDQALFTIDSQSGQVLFLSLPDFESPGDANADNLYEFEVSVSDGTSSTQQSVSLTVTDFAESPQIDGDLSVVSLSLAEDGSTTYDFNATDPDSGSSLTWTLSVNPSNGSATIDPSSGILTYIPSTNFFGSDTLTVSVTDGAFTVSKEVNLSVIAENDTPVFSSGPTFSVKEGNSIVTTLSASDADGDVYQFMISGGTDEAKFSLGASSGELSFMEPPSFANPSDHDSDNQYHLMISVSDGPTFSTQGIVISVLEVEGSDQNQTTGTSGQTEDSKVSGDSGLVELASDLGSGWKQSTWFGSFYADSHPWLYHVNLGWIYLSESGVNTWIYEETLGWLWTDPVTYPFLYQFVEDSGNWLYLDTLSDRGRIYDYGTPSWSNLR